MGKLEVRVQGVLIDVIDEGEINLEELETVSKDYSSEVELFGVESSELQLLTDEIEELKGSRDTWMNEATKYKKLLMLEEAEKELLQEQIELLKETIEDLEHL